MMMVFDPHDCELTRSTWRDFARECQPKHPDLVSLVGEPDGPTVGIFRRDGAFTFEHDGETFHFDKLTYAEDAAARLLAADHDMTGDW
ncbi:hypothetical protein O2N63_09010 [Aliiroseovarius sp. KMU-50]|uniref:Uncharacterized protein n=1 Tax=Aliiroseovarius salicola TaxID=3009082 RepID=A0ABT4W142_9RHOB|nr:hypothetical protein [Aliiroseovarius sp. KMU-50]MDA5094227.1 hypothetical protein [Aliiroseovarius sp. KMU-50]